MMKRLTLSLFLALVSTLTFAQYTTAGDGTTYNIKTLAALSGSGIEEVPPQPDWGSIPVYTIGSSVTVAAGDKFVMDDGIALLFAADVSLTIEGEADFQLTKGSVFGSATDEPYLGSDIIIKGAGTTNFTNCKFSYLGLRLMTEGSVNIDNCKFYDHDGSAAAAVLFVSAGNQSTISNCYFEHCQKAAIGSAANASQPLLIDKCTFEQNSLANNNIPQINITAANQIIIQDCQVTGTPEKNMVGGIGISNFMSFESSVLISGCTISDNRYGIGLVGPADIVRIEDCTLMNNRYETNPMNGGSGISFYDPYLKTQAVISGNHIEGSLWGVTVIGCKDVSLGQPENTDIDSPGGNVFKNNGNGGQLYDLYNNSTLTIYAQNNTWNVTEQTQEQIETVIFHKTDDASLGEVIYWPAASTSSINPSSVLLPPFSLTIYDLNGRPLNVPQKGINIINGKKVVY